jgi:excisionase family DNA binding protein
MVRSDADLIDDFLDGDPLLSTDEVATLLRVSVKTVSRWAAIGWFPDARPGVPGAMKVGGLWRIRESVVRGLIDGTLTPREAGRDQ